MPTRGAHGFRSSSNTFLNDSSQVNQFTNRASRFHAARKNESWSTAASNLQEMESAMRQLDRDVPSADAAAYVAAARKSIGLLPADEMKALFARTLDELLDDANQDRLAVYYFQRAAAIPACPVPIAELKRRLQNIRKKSADAYEKGTEDSLKSTMESPVGSYQNVLMVPAAPKAADGGSTPEEPKGE